MMTDEWDKDERSKEKLAGGMLEQLKQINNENKKDRSIDINLSISPFEMQYIAKLLRVLRKQ